MYSMSNVERKLGVTNAADARASKKRNSRFHHYLCLRGMEIRRNFVQKKSGVIMLCILACLCIGCNTEDKNRDESSSSTEITHITEKNTTTATVDNRETMTTTNVDETTTTTAIIEDTTTVTTAVVYGELIADWSTPYAVPEKSLVVDVKGDVRDISFVWYKDGKIIEAVTSSRYDVSEEDLEHFISVDIVRNEELITSLRMYISRLPVMYIDTENNAEIVSKEEYINATMSLQGSELFSDNEWLYEGAIEIKGRGNSTWKRFDKKPYKIKLDSKSDLLGMGGNKHWVLLANYIDESLMRNALGFRFAEQLGLVTMQSTWVDVVLNGSYVGNYLLCEQIRVSDERVDIKDWENIAEDIAKEIYKVAGLTTGQRDSLEDLLKKNLLWVTTGKVTFGGKEYIINDYYRYDADITEGYLIELSAEYDEISKFKTEKGASIMIKSPEYVNTNSAMFSHVKELIQAFEDAIYSEDGYTTYKGKTVHYSDLCNVESLVDYWIVIETFFCPDAIWKSRYMYVGEDGRLTFGPVWDFDFSSGGNNPWSYIVYNEWRSTTTAENNYWLGALIRQPDFVNMLYERYHEVRGTAIAELIEKNGIISEWQKYLSESGKANTKLWKYVQGFEKDVKSLSTWLKNRVNWMDAQMKSLETLAESFKVKDVDGDKETDKETDTSFVSAEIKNPDRQLELIASSVSIWKTDDSNKVYKYAVADLDGNGCLDIVVSHMDETGRNTYSCFYEVNEAMDGLVQCEADFTEGNSQADIMQDLVNAYYDKEDKALHYIFEDYVRVSPSGYRLIITALKLQAGKIVTQPLAYEHQIHYKGTVSSTYHMISGEEIAKEEFAKITDTIYTGCEKYELSLGWRDISELEEDNKEKIVSFLKKSYEIFKISKK